MRKKRPKSLAKRLARVRDLIAFGDFYLTTGTARSNNLRVFLSLWSSAGILVYLINTAFGKEIINLKGAIIFTPLIFVVLMIVGIVDIKVLHYTQKLNEISNWANPTLYNKIIATLKNTKKIKRQVISDTTKKRIGVKRVIFH